MAEKTSLEKSHSKASNFKLTMICLLASLAVTALWCGIVLIGKEHYRTLGIIAAAAGGVVSIISVFLIGRFTR